MKPLLIRLVAVLFLLPLALRGADVDADARHFLQPGDPAYDALKTAVERKNLPGWEASRVKKNMPITNLVARELARALLADTSLMQQYKEPLEAAFPSETKPVDLKYELLSKEIKILEKQVQKVSAKLDRFEAGMRDGLLSGRSRPSLLFALDLNIFSAETWTGLEGGLNGFHIVGSGGSGLWTEWTLSDTGYNLTWVMEFYDGYIDFRDAHLGLFFDNWLLPGVEVGIADETSYPALSLLAFNGGGGGFEDDFLDIHSLSGRKDFLKSSAGFGARGGQDIYIRKKNSEDWWPFSDTQIVASQTYFYFYQYRNDLAVNVKLRGVPLPWPFERGDPSFTNLWTFTDQADLNGYGSSDPYQNSSAQSLAFNAQLAGGGSLFLEAATAEWESQTALKAYRDYAVLMVMSKSVGQSAFALDFQHTGADYYAGTRGEPAGNAAESLYTEMRPSRNPKGDVYATIASEPTYPASNAEHVSLGWTYDLPASTFGLTFGSNIGINPSGPWIVSRHMVGWPWYRLGDKNGGHGFHITPAGESRIAAAYNPPGQAPGYDGNILIPIVKWTVLDSFNQETITLSKKGVGDPVLREDSVKYVNFVDFRGDFNIQSMFNLQRPALIKFSTRLRNTDEAFGIPTVRDSSLLMQIAESMTFNVEFPGHMQLVTAVAYEDWKSQASYFPIDYHTTWAYLQFFKDFPEFLSGLTMGPYFAVMRHYDTNREARTFSGWFVGISSGTVF
ncbi:MAG: hypothetical protein V4498_09305 [candidate division FCPU426 bacterium]